MTVDGVRRSPVRQITWHFTGVRRLHRRHLLGRLGLPWREPLAGRRGVQGLCCFQDTPGGRIFGSGTAAFYGRSTDVAASKCADGPNSAIETRSDLQFKLTGGLGRRYQMAALPINQFRC